MISSLPRHDDGSINFIRTNKNVIPLRYFHTLCVGMQAIYISLSKRISLHLINRVKPKKTKKKQSLHEINEFQMMLNKSIHMHHQIHTIGSTKRKSFFTRCESIAHGFYKCGKNMMYGKSGWNEWTTMLSNSEHIEAESLHQFSNSWCHFFSAPLDEI